MLDVSVKRPKCRKNDLINIIVQLLCSFFVFSAPLLDFARIPWSKPIHLDLEKLFLLSVSKEKLDFRRKHRKN